MKNIVLYLATLVLLGCQGSPYQYFHGTFEDAKAAAGSKLIFLKFYTNT
ncbi:uncharacterized protein METZ01_LOCUS213117 [marine metagenome]|uniref:Uncharacterized protein n=1 Tax=marine metagenome TaxID=408172 RepID=A0A382FDH8_9ZZZZ